jgi:CheY-like chemotaxis protein
MDEALIVHIDDRSAFRNVFRNVVRGTGYHVTSYRDSLEAKAAMPLNADVVVVDSSGTDFARMIREGQPDVCVIVLSSRPDEARVQADAVISKGDADWPTKVLDVIARRIKATGQELVGLDVPGYEPVTDGITEDEVRRRLASDEPRYTTAEVISHLESL